jgi:hypothetical protein
VERTLAWIAGRSPARTWAPVVPSLAASVAVPSSSYRIILAVPLAKCRRASPVAAREHRLGRFAPRDQHGQPPRRRLGVREFAQLLFPTHPVGVDRLVVDGAAHRRAGGRPLKQAVERLALAVIERAEHLVLDR